MDRQRLRDEQRLHRRKLLTFPELRDRGVPYCRDHVRALVKQGKFPPPVKISTKRIGWVDDEIDGWVEQLIAERDNAQAA